jgi:hypothetical protein
MKIDLYTKIVLTMIAMTLIGIFLKDVNVIQIAHAAQSEIMDVRIKKVDKDAFKQYGSDVLVPVEIKEPTLNGVEVYVKNWPLR